MIKSKDKEINLRQENKNRHNKKEYTKPVIQDVDLSFLALELEKSNELNENGNIINDDSIFEKNESVIYVEDKDVIRIFSPDTNVMVELLGTGPEIWKLIDGKKNVRQIIEHLYEIYDINYDTLKQDIYEFIMQLLNRKLIRKIK